MLHADAQTHGLQTTQAQIQLFLMHAQAKERLDARDFSTPINKD
jgi:hypothetical protein